MNLFGSRNSRLIYEQLSKHSIQDIFRYPVHRPDPYHARFSAEHSPCLLMGYL